MNWKPKAFKTLQQKARLLLKIRAFFLQQDILEVNTPLLSPYGTTDPTIESLVLSYQQRDYYLPTSPEFYMKRLIAAGSGSIFQIAHAFRAEEVGKNHLTEFTLLEWYCMGWNYETLMQQVHQLINECLDKTIEIPTYTYAGLFQQYTGINPLTISDEDLRKRVPDNLADLDRDALLDYFLSIEIMPQLKSAGWFFVKDYPASQASLAQLKADDPTVAERFELFHNGLELANGFSELQDAKEQLERFQQDNQKRALNKQQQIPIDELLIAALDSGLPKCAGVALGVDRLFMVLFQLNDIQEIGLH
ncbi:MAG: EF-P lysine aminoacylase GenX [Gammaproteobacteria bacterium]|nr:EF-P lysine aminoacylase GenX [Gammaproteobacteria bacterium]